MQCVFPLDFWIEEEATERDSLLMKRLCSSIKAFLQQNDAGKYLAMFIVLVTGIVYKTRNAMYSNLMPFSIQFS